MSPNFIAGHKISRICLNRSCTREVDLSLNIGQYLTKLWIMIFDGVIIYLTSPARTDYWRTRVLIRSERRQTIDKYGTNSWLSRKQDALLNRASNRRGGSTTSLMFVAMTTGTCCRSRIVVVSQSNRNFDYFRRSRMRRGIVVYDVSWSCRCRIAIVI